MSVKRSLHRKTLMLLNDSNIPLLTLYRTSGIPYFWLKKFKNDEIKDPSVNRIQDLYEFLMGKSLEV